MAAIPLKPADQFIATHHTHTVFLRRLWTDPWVAEPHMEAFDMVFTTGDAFDTAKIRWRAGEIMQFDETEFKNVELRNDPPEGTAPAITRYFVKIELDQTGSPAFPTRPIRWYGTVVREVQALGGRVGTDGAPLTDPVAADQDYLCLGFDWLLSRAFAQGTYFLDKNANATGGERSSFSERAIPFNDGAGVVNEGWTTAGNRSAEISTFTDGPQFSEAPGGELDWTADKIVEYMLTNFSPHNKPPTDASRVADPILFELDPASVRNLSWFKPVISPQGRTTLDVLRNLINKKRLLTWWIEIQESDLPEFFRPVDTAVLFVATQLGGDVDIVLPGGSVVPVNPVQLNLDLDTWINAKKVAIKFEAANKYSQVIVRGAYATSTFTALKNADPLVHGWDNLSLQQEYEDAASLGSAAPPYAGLTDTKKAERNDAVRSTDKFTEVFNTYLFAHNWAAEIMPVLDDFGVPVVPDAWEPILWPSMRILRETPLRVGVDYSDPTNLFTTDPANFENQRSTRRPFGVVEVNDQAGDPQFVFIDKITDAFGESKGGDFKSSVGLTILRSQPGFRYTVGSESNHYIGLNTTSAFAYSGIAEPSNTDPKVNGEEIEVTCTVEWDSYCQGIFPETEIALTNLPFEVLIINVGDGYRLDYLAENTTVDIDINNERVLSSPRAFIRNDIVILRDMAQMAFEWYARVRSSLTLTWDYLEPLVYETDNRVRLGDFVRNIGTGENADTVDSVVTFIRYDIRNGMTTMMTSYGELDVKALV